jgi:hypothetical protein
MSLFRQGISNGGRGIEVNEVHGVFPAIEMALENAGEGDLVLLQCDTIDETVAFVKQYMDCKRAGREINLDEVLADDELQLVHSTALASDPCLHSNGSMSAGAASAATAVAVDVAELAAMRVD